MLQQACVTIEAFENHLVAWTRAACREWGWREPGHVYYERVANRLPEGLRALLSEGIEQGLIIPQGKTFTLKGLAPGKGPYSWFSRHSAERGPNPNWEYFVQAAEFVRLGRIAERRHLTVTFEDYLMDLALYDGARLLVCVEVKERASQIELLIRQLRAYESAVPLSGADRGNDPLRKAKYIARRRPEYFCGVAIGLRLEYAVHYAEERAFRLVRDVVPWV